MTNRETNRQYGEEHRGTDTERGERRGDREERQMDSDEERIRDNERVRRKETNKAKAIGEPECSYPEKKTETEPVLLQVFI